MSDGALQPILQLMHAPSLPTRTAAVNAALDYLADKLVALAASDGPFRFTRVPFRGPLPDQPTDYERGILDWLGQTALSER